ncbi:hypothetical protein H0H81_012658 [Sphagnurus paluster]|uniref:SET domain-containing protein n=1 Tax=Sphagnurus paluster TaxID=117069 RepID=A0A9P7K4Y9_9AGAR|nr:hypothetical protein H0H81_012658 [Sphagnurus paluster]
MSAESDMNDGVKGLEWLRGTEVERLDSHPGQNLEAIDEYYFSIAEPLLLGYLDENELISTRKPTLDGFHHAYTLVSSRAFLVDAYHGLAMVPIADAFNHSQENHVHIETEFSVCFQCGSLYECEHDFDLPQDESHLLRRRRKFVDYGEDNNFDAYYEMVANTPIPPNSEVYNTYGETLTNAQLLTQYGFVLDVNDNDSINWNIKQVYMSCTDLFDGCTASLQELESIRSTVLAQVEEGQTLERIAESSLAYRKIGTTGEHLCLDSDGKISHQLWILLALPLLLRRIPGELEEQLGEIKADLESLLGYQLFVENTLQGEGEQEGDDYHNPSVKHMGILSDLAHALIDLCGVRKAQIGRPAWDDDFGCTFDHKLRHKIQEMKPLYN